MTTTVGLRIEKKKKKKKKKRRKKKKKKKKECKWIYIVGVDQTYKLFNL